MHPSVSQASSPLERRFGMATDEYRHRMTGHRRHLHGRDVEDLAVVLEPPIRCQAAHDLDALVHPLSAPLPRHVGEGVILRPRAGAHAEHEPVTGQHGDRARLLGDQDRMPNRELDHERREPDAFGDGADSGDERERLDEGLVLQELPSPVGVVGVGGVRLPRVGQAVGHHEVVVPGLLDRLGQRRVEGRVDHRLCI